MDESGCQGVFAFNTILIFRTEYFTISLNELVSMFEMAKQKLKSVYYYA